MLRVRAVLEEPRSCRASGDSRGAADGSASEGPAAVLEEPPGGRGLAEGAVLRVRAVLEEPRARRAGGGTGVAAPPPEEERKEPRSRRESCCLAAAGAAAVL